MSYLRFVNQVTELTGCRDRAAVERTIAATLEVLGMRLREVDALAVAAQLPEPLAARLRSAAYTGECDIEEFRRRVRRHCEQALADEHIRAVCALLAEMLNEQARTQLRIQPLASLFGMTA